MMTYYEILEIERDATEKEIKSAYRKLAKKWHPDTTQFDKEYAALKFKEVTNAYNVLSDTAKRKNYDYNLDCEIREREQNRRREQARKEAEQRRREQERQEAERRRQEQLRREAERRRQEQARQEAERRRQEQARQEVERRRQEQARREEERKCQERLNRDTERLYQERLRQEAECKYNHKEGRYSFNISDKRRLRKKVEHIMDSILEKIIQHFALIIITMPILAAISYSRYNFIFPLPYRELNGGLWAGIPFFLMFIAGPANDLLKEGKLNLKNISFKKKSCVFSALCIWWLLCFISPIIYMWFFNKFGEEGLKIVDHLIYKFFDNINAIMMIYFFSLLVLGPLSYIILKECKLNIKFRNILFILILIISLINISIGVYNSSYEIYCLTGFDIPDFLHRNGLL